MKQAKHKWRGFGEISREKEAFNRKVRELRHFRCSKCGAVIRAEVSAKIPKSVWEGQGVKTCDEQIVQGVMSV